MLRPGDIVGPYEIRELVGQGGMGQVYRAFDPRLERTVALKVVVFDDSATKTEDGGDPPRTTFDAQAARMLREARAVASLSHPNVVAIYDVGESNGRLYFAMEYVVGASLRTFVGNVEVPLARRVRWLVDVARALEAAHTAGIIHRDIKPENVMIRDDGGVKVLDFGIARRAVSHAQDEPGEPKERDEQRAVDTVTGGGSITGTPVYMAPEQIKGADVDARCDQFAWGVMAYELVTGARPWTETANVLSVVADILTKTPAPIRTRTKDVPAVVQEAILRALAKDPALRFASMADVAAALEPFASRSADGDRVRVTPRPRPEDDPAYAATTRVPTTVSIAPSPTDEAAPRTPETPPRRAFALALPLVLLGALGATVYAVKARDRTATAAPVTARASRPLSTVPEAEAAFKEAMSSWRDGATSKARASLVRAVELDPTFAAAHLELALQRSASDPPAAQASFQSAFEHRHMLLPRDERLLEASEPFIRAHPDVEEWETRLSSAVFQYPKDPELQYYLGRARQRGGDHEGARLAFDAALRLDEGFIPALAAIARSEKSAGDVAAGLATTERCVERSPIASTCVEARFELLFAANECRRAKDEAARWGALEPQSPRPFASLARALHADGAPRPSVEEALSRRWSLISGDDSKRRAELWDRARLAVLDGDLVRAEELAQELDGLLPLTADAFDRAAPGRLRIAALMEMNRTREAARVARTYLDRLPAWPTYPFAPDPSIAFLEPVFRAGELTKHELDAQRAAWLERERERQRSSGGPRARDPWTAWATVYGGFAESREEAAEALAHAPADEGLPADRGLFVDFALGKVYALLGRWDDARPNLDRVVSTCESFDAIMIVTRMRLYLGQAQEAKGELAAARATYESIVTTWPKTPTSRTVNAASDHLATISRD